MSFFNLSLLFLALVLAASPSASPFKVPLRLKAEKPAREDELFCGSWRLSVETNNAGSWSTVPSKCVASVAAYMDSDKYVSDSDVAAADALEFAKTVEVAGDGKDVWVFDVDETLLANLPYYRENGYGSEPFNETAFDEWVYSAKAPALPASLKLFRGVQQLGFRPVILTGRSEEQRAVTLQNLLLVGYHSWERLILRGSSDQGTTAVAYKSGRRAKLEVQGYRIHGNVGDQWSDLIGSPMATRSFKLPNPMYYIA